MKQKLSYNQTALSSYIMESWYKVRIQIMIDTPSGVWCLCRMF